MAKRRGRSVFAINASITTALIIIIATVALLVTPPSPPGVAAFAPQASKPITKAPSNQSAASGQGTAACNAGQSCASAASRATNHSVAAAARATAASAVATPTPPTGVPSDLQCTTWPDGAVTQTFDPQSPPCVATWPGQAQGNGGATSTGVAASTIEVAVPENASNSSVPALQSLVNFFNTHYELYGRRIVLRPYTAAAASVAEAGDSEKQVSDADAAAALKTFAATDYFDQDPNDPTLPAYMDTLAEHHVISLSGGATSPFDTDAALAAHAPYEWSYFPTLSTLFASAASAVCRQLAGHDATHSGDYTSVKRKFAIIAPEEADAGQLSGITQFQSQISGCSGSSVPLYYYDSSDGTGPQPDVSDELLDLKREGVTTIVKFPWFDDSDSGAERDADSVNYDPEWFILGWAAWLTADISYAPTAQIQHMFGVGNWNKLTPTNQLPWNVAYLDGGGSADESFHGAEMLYHELSILAAGVQMAGPHLTPATFAAALHGTQFPNPGAGVAPSYQATVDFPGDTMVQDDNEFWFSSSANTANYLSDDANFNPWDLYCYAQLGLRGDEESWSTRDTFLQSGVCR